MMPIRIIETLEIGVEPMGYNTNNELTHWKYIKREKVKGKWRYYYDYKSVKKDIKSAVTKTKTSIEKTVASVKNKIHKYVAKVPTEGDEYRYFYSDEAYKAYMKGKNAVDNIMKKTISASPSDVAKANVRSFVNNVVFGGFGKAVYNIVAPALVALQVELTTPKSFSELNKTKTKQTSDEHQLAVNPDYDQLTYDYSMNCSFCTAAYDLRKRGYDVEANPISQSEAYTIDDICSWYKGARPVYKFTVDSEHTTNRSDDKKNLSESERLIENLKSQGEGARGHLALYWYNGGAHDVIWEVENDEVVLRDCQTGEISRTFSELSYAYDYAYVRTDNLEPTDAVLRTVRNRKMR